MRFLAHWVRYLPLRGSFNSSLPFLPIALILLALLSGLSLRSIWSEFNTIDQIERAELSVRGAEIASQIQANLQNSLAAIGGLSETAGVGFALQAPRGHIEANTLEVIRLLAVSVLELNPAIIRLIMLDGLGHSKLVVTKEADGSQPLPPQRLIPSEWNLGLVQPSPLLSRITEDKKVLQLIRTIPSRTPGIQDAFFYAEVDLEHILSLIGSGFKEKEYVEIRTRISQLLSAESKPLTKFDEINCALLLAGTCRIQLRQYLNPAIPGYGLVVDVMKKSPEIRAAAEKTVLWILAWTLLTGFVLLSIFFYVRQLYVLPLQRLSTKLSTELELLDSGSMKKTAVYGDTVSQLARMMNFVVNELADERLGLGRRHEEAYAELYSTRARLEQVTSASGAIALSFDRLDGRILYRTSSLDSLLRLTPASEMPTWRGIYRLLSRNFRRQLSDSLRRVVRYNNASVVITLKLGEQKRSYDVRLSLSQSKDLRMSRVDALAIDNTDHVAFQSALIRSEERKSAIMNASPIAFLALSITGEILEANPAAERLTSLDKLQLIGVNALGNLFKGGDERRIHDFIHSSKNLSFQQLAEDSFSANCLTGAQAVPVLIRLGFAHSGIDPYVCLYLEDMRERMLRSIELVRKGRELDAVFDLSPGGIAIFGDDNRLVSLNKTMRTWLDLSGIKMPKSSLIADFWRLLKSQSRDDSLLHLARHVDQGAGAIDFKGEHRLTLKYKEKILFDDQGSAFSRVIYFTDITQEFMLDESKSVFLATAAHELRTPLAVILGFSELLSSENYSMEEIRSLAGSIHNHSLHLRELVGDLLDLAKIEAEGAGQFRFERCELSGWLEQAIILSTTETDSIRFFNQHKLDLLIADEVRGLKSNIDQSKLGRVLMNLLSNADKFSPERSPITVAMKVGEDADAGSILLIVSDRGVGISPQDCRMLFKRFWRSERSSDNTSGTGLGLAICKEIIDFHGGKIRVSSVVGLGTEVTVALKISADS